MTFKQKLIIDFLIAHEYRAYYCDIRDSISMPFEDESDFDRTLRELESQNILFENDRDTLYILNQTANLGPA